MATVTLDPQAYVESGETYNNDQSTSRQENYVYILATGGEIPVSVEPTKAGYLAVDSLISVWGEGDSQESAMEDLLRVLRERLEDLQSHAGRMSPRLESQLRLLEHVFRAHGNL